MLHDASVLVTAWKNRTRALFHPTQLTLLEQRMHPHPSSPHALRTGPVFSTPPLKRGAGSKGKKTGGCARCVFSVSSLYYREVHLDCFPYFEIQRSQPMYLFKSSVFSLQDVISRSCWCSKILNSIQPLRYT